MNLLKDKYIIVEVIPTSSDSKKGIIAQLSALKLDGIKLIDRFDYRVDEKLVNNKDNINEFLGIMELFTRKVGYYFEFNQELYDKQVVNVKKRGLKKSALINISDVIQDYMKILYLDNNNAKELIVNKLEELKWITFKEQEKYNIGNISEVFTKGK